MLSVNYASGAERTMRSLTGLTIQGFTHLVPAFLRAREEKQWTAYTKRQRQAKTGVSVRQPGGGSKGKLDTIEQKLLFILVYFKCYPTMDVMGALFGVKVSAVKKNIDKFTPLLERALGRKQALPKRRINSLQEFFETFPEVKDAFIDGTERPIQRPKHKQKRKNNYSGKKKRTTKKNIVGSDEKNTILYLSPTKAGKKHDYGLFKQFFDPSVIPKSIALWLDMGFTGIQKDYPDIQALIPTRKSKGKELTDEQKEHNSIVSSIRVRVEHAIGGAKRYKIVSDTFRNKSDRFNDTVMFLSCGLWNYQLKYC